jgi:hypothetical protein
VPAVRTISFARVLPKLATKLIRIPAMFGGAMVAGLAYIQYQANRMMLMFHSKFKEMLIDCVQKLELTSSMSSSEVQRLLERPPRLSGALLATWLARLSRDGNERKKI